MLAPMRSSIYSLALHCHHSPTGSACALVLCRDRSKAQYWRQGATRFLNIGGPIPGAPLTCIISRTEHGQKKAWRRPLPLHVSWC
ncbi:hypothetical protein NDU88_004002 [Pleurodeles waltl]|uniref:Secreted protein n=1 Tax=Pleurodeles waltl TaxID=8319 RepID=A0AAV7SHK1_PLEWA|nr:hypothetical protein NDU88_004002 [Pleurodeles waltl]